MRHHELMKFFSLVLVTNIVKSLVINGPCRRDDPLRIVAARHTAPTRGMRPPARSSLVLNNTASGMNKHTLRSMAPPTKLAHTLSSTSRGGCHDRCRRRRTTRRLRDARNQGVQLLDLGLELFQLGREICPLLRQPVPKPIDQWCNSLVDRCGKAHHHALRSRLGQQLLDAAAYHWENLSRRRHAITDRLHASLNC